MLLPVVLGVMGNLASGAFPGNAPSLPITGARIVNVNTEAQLQTAVVNLQSGDTILLVDGIYNLTSSLYVLSAHSQFSREAQTISSSLRAKTWRLANAGGA